MALSLQYWVNYTAGNIKLQRRSEAAVSSGRVLSFVYDQEFRVVNAHVQASMKDKSYKIMLYLTDGFGVSHSNCGCPLQESLCHHVAAALLFGYRHVAKTDVKCSWLKHPKTAPPKDTQTMGELFPSSKPEFRALDRPFDESDKDFMFKSLSSLGRFTAIHWVLSPEVRQDEELQSVAEFLASPEYINSDAPRHWLRDVMTVSPLRIEQIAELTTGQRTNPLWSMVRKLRLTASNFSVVLDAIEKNRITKSCMKRLLSAYNLEKVAPIIWGITHEAKALQWYKNMGAEIKETGIWLHSSGALGASPDGIVARAPQLAPHFQSAESQLFSPDLVEVKCPYSARESTIAAAVKGCKDFFLDDVSGHLKLKENHSYYHQIQGQLYLTHKYCADLLVWTPQDVQIIRIVKNPSWECNLEKMKNFYFTSFLDKLDE